MEWVSDVSSPNDRILWIHGPLGSGKSAIAQTLAKNYTSESTNNCKLAASFFFSSTAPDRNTDKNLIATLAYQLVRSISGVEDYSAVLGPVVKSNPAIFESSLEEQIKSLIAKPLMQAVKGLKSYSWPYLVIIDGVDECSERDTQLNIINAIGVAIKEYDLPLRFIITSRPDMHLTTLFGSEDIEPISKHISLQNSQFDPEIDIECYLRSELARIWEGRLRGATSRWYTELDISAILHRSNGLFIYARMVIEFVENLKRQPDKQLKMMVAIPVIHGDPISPFAELECIYDLLGANVNEVTSETIAGRPYGACVYKHLLVDSREALFRFLSKLSTEQLRALIQDGSDIYRAHIHHK